MFKKLKQKIKNKLKKQLDIEDLENNFNKYIHENCIKLKQRDIKMNDLKCKDEEQQNQINSLNTTLRNVVSVGANVESSQHFNKEGRSWAIICIEGNYNIVKFIDMKGNNYKEILNFLKQFECSRRVVDAPSLRMFEEEFIMFKED